MIASILGLAYLNGDSSLYEDICSCLKSNHSYFFKEITLLFFPWRRKWQPTPVFLPGEFHGQRSLAGSSPWSCKESDTTEQLTHILFPVLRSPDEILYLIQLLCDIHRVHHLKKCVSLLI